MIHRCRVFERSIPAAINKAKLITSAPARKSGYVLMYGVMPNLSSTRSCGRLSVDLSTVAVIARLENIRKVLMIDYL